MHRLGIILSFLMNYSQNKIKMQVAYIWAFSEGPFCVASIDWSKCLHPTSKHELVRLDVNYHDFVFNGEIDHVISEFSILFFCTCVT